MASSTCVTFKANTHLANSEKGYLFRQENGFLGERIKFGFNTSALVINQLAIRSKSQKRVKHGVVSAILTSKNAQESLTLQVPSILRRRADPENVVSIILGGGPGTQLFPLTKRAATPAVPVGGCYRLIDIPMSNCINSGINKIFVLTQFNSASLNRHIARTYFGNGINFGDGIVEVLAATQTPGEAGKKWFQGTADAVRQFTWDAKNTNVENVLILAGDHLYRMDYMDLVQSHIDRNADITVSCAAVDDSRASDYGLVKVDDRGRIIHFSEKPKSDDLNAMQADTSLFGLSPQDALKSPYIASMGVYVFKTEVLLNLLKWRYPTSNDFGSEIIPAAVRDHNVQRESYLPFMRITPVTEGKQCKSYFYGDYWEDIGTIKSFYDANLALTEEIQRNSAQLGARMLQIVSVIAQFIETNTHLLYATPLQSHKFEFYDPKTPIYTSPGFLPPTKIDKCRIVDAIISHGCFLRECTVQHSIVGERSRLDYGVELLDTVMMGADYYQTESEIASLLAEGKVPIGIGRSTKIRNCIIDKNAKIGKDVIIANKDGVEEADRPEEGFYIRSGITIIMEKATIEDGTVI
ncbi:Glucose-1-phosphate adenylyltransferase large subunit 1, partial [Mucuna pruriens]